MPSRALYQHFYNPDILTTVFANRSKKLERIDTGDYTPEEYDRFLVDIRKVNRFAGDSRALKRTLLQKLRKVDVGCMLVDDDAHRSVR